jgi:hypothetical protein
MSIGHPVFTSLDFATMIFLILLQTPNLEDQFSVFIFLSERVVQLYPPKHQVPFFVAFDDSQGYGGGILTGLHKGLLSRFSVLTQAR